MHLNLKLCCLLHYKDRDTDTEGAKKDERSLLQKYLGLIWQVGWSEDSRFILSTFGCMISPCHFIVTINIYKQICLVLMIFQCCASV